MVGLLAKACFRVAFLWMPTPGDCPKGKSPKLDLMDTFA